MWVLTGVVIIAITILLVVFRSELFSSMPVPWPNDDIAILDPSAVATKIQAENERRERIENEKFLAAQKAKKQWRMSLNNQALQPNHLGLPSNSMFRGIVKSCEDYYHTSVKPSAQLKRDNEKLWAVCIIIYTDVCLGSEWYGDLNTSLREGKTEFHGYRDHMNDALNYLIIKDKERGKGPPAILYRGVGFKADQEHIARGIKQSNCDTFANSKQYMSTSEDQSVARNFASGAAVGELVARRYQFHCVLRGVTKAACIVDYGIKSETEWLIPTNSSFTVKVSGTLTHCNVIMEQNKWEDKKRRRLCERLDRETTAERYYHESESTHVEY